MAFKKVKLNPQNEGKYVIEILLVFCRELNFTLIEFLVLNTHLSEEKSVGNCWQAGCFQKVTYS